MKKFADYAYLVFLCPVPLILLIGVFIREAHFDINIHDTYFVMAYGHMIILISVYFGVVGLIYWLMRIAKIALSKSLTLAHLGLTFGGIIGIMILTLFHQDTILAFEFNYFLNLIIILMLLLVCLSQIIFPINIISGLINKNS